MVFNDEAFRAFLFKAINTSKDKKSPYRHECYEDCVNHADEMSVHLYGQNPAKLLNITRPREDPETKTYRLQSYQPTTKATSEKAISILAKMFNTSLYSITWKDQSNAGTELQTYTLEEFPIYNSVMNLLQQTVLKKMLADPNGVLAVRPKSLIMDNAERAKPIVKVYGSSSIWFRDETLSLIWLKTEQDAVINQTVFYFECYDQTNIIEFSAYLDRNGIDGNSLVIQNEILYPHDGPEMPVWQLGGTPEAQDNGTVIYKSYFDGALSFWNLAVIHESDLHGAYINHMHPIRAEIAEECDYTLGNQRCRMGKITSDTGDFTECPRCEGSGYKSVKSPYGVYKYNKDKLSGEGSGGLTPVQYITVPTDATKMLEERVASLHERGLNAINMDIVNKVGANQSGTAKVIDRSELNDFMAKIADQMFSVHLNNMYYYMNIQMNKPQAKASLSNPDVDKNLPEINKPINFDIASAEQLINNLETIKKAGLSPEFLKNAEKKIAAKQFSTDTDSLNIMNLQIDLDPIPDLAVADIISLQSGVQKMWTTEEQTVHYNLVGFIDRAMLEVTNFLTLNVEEQKEILNGYATEKMKLTKNKIDTSNILDSTVDEGKITQPV